MRKKNGDKNFLKLNMKKGYHAKGKLTAQQKRLAKYMTASLIFSISENSRKKQIIKKSHLDINITNDNFIFSLNVKCLYCIIRSLISVCCSLLLKLFLLSKF